jgi:hypothetical protein
LSSYYYKCENYKFKSEFTEKKNIELVDEIADLKYRNRFDLFEWTLKVLFVLAFSGCILFIYRIVLT